MPQFETCIIQTPHLVLGPPALSQRVSRDLRGLKSLVRQEYYRNGFGFYNQKNELQGFFLPEFGSGLVLSRNNRAGVELLRLKHSKKGKRTRIPVNNQAGITVLKSLNLRQGDNYTRMTLGKEIRWNPEFIYSFGGGYCG